MGRRHRLGHRRLPQRHERDHVHRPEPGVFTPVLIHVNQAHGRHAYGERSLGYRLQRPDEAEHGAVVSSIAGHIHGDVGRCSR